MSAQLHRLVFIFLILFGSAGYVGSRNLLWMTGLANNDATKDSFKNAKLYDVLFPGSSNSAAYVFDNSQDSLPDYEYEAGVTIPTTSSTYDITRSSLLDWAVTQDLTIKKQIAKGIRFFDFHFEYYNNDWRIHNYIYGDTVANVIRMFQDWRTSADGELFIISFSKFHKPDVHDANIYDIFWQTVFADRTCTNSCLNKDVVLESTTDLATATMETILQSAAFIVITEEYSDVPPVYQPYVFDASVFMAGQSSGASAAGTMTQYNLNALRAGWTNTKLMQVFYTLTPTYADIKASLTSGAIVVEGQVYHNQEELNENIIFNLGPNADTTPRLRWGNIILADFVGKSDLVDQVIRLNYNYLSCDDTFTARGTSDVLDTCKYKLENSQCDAEQAIPDTTNCKRTCGMCPILNGTLYKDCTVNNECENLGGGQPNCFKAGEYVTDNSQLTYYTEKQEFCLVQDPISSCAEYDDYITGLQSYGSCGGSTNSEEYYRTQFDTYCENCANSGQCLHGVCNKQFQICINPPISKNATQTVRDTADKPAYVRDISEKCEDFRSDVGPLRFSGDPDADFDFGAISDIFKSVQKGSIPSLADPYLKSIYTFALFPIIWGILMLIILIMMPMVWICSKVCGWHDKYEAYCCRFDSEQKYSHGQIVVPFILLFAYSLLILFFCSNAIVMNGEISENILESDGVVDLINQTLNIATDYMGNVIGPTEIIVTTLELTFDNAQELVDNTDHAQTLIEATTTVTQDVTSEWITKGLAVSIISNNNVYNFTCLLCEAIIQDLDTVGTEIDTYAVSATQEMYDIVVNIQSDLLDQEDDIMSDVNEYYTILKETKVQTEETRVSILETMTQLESVEDNRSITFVIFFMLPMILLIIGITAFCLGIKTCFKINYALAFILSTVTWILYGFFNVTVVIWADTCVRLDDMETNILNSTLLDQMYSDASLKDTVDACLNGKYLPDVFNVTASLDYRELENQIYEQLTVDITSMFDIPLLTKYENFVQVLNKDSYMDTVDALIIAFNEYDQSPPLTREFFDNNGDTSIYGVYQTAVDQIKDYYDVEQANIGIGGPFDVRATEFKSDSQQIFTAYDELESFASDVLQQNLTFIKCSLDPVFEQMDVLLYDNSTAWCNTVGIVYGKMKKKGCEDLFTNFEYTNRSLLVIAIFELFIGFLAVCLGRRIDRRFNIFDQKSHDFGVSSLQLAKR